jgi:hypothetical protein
MSRYEVVIGREFEIDAVEVEESPSQAKPATLTDTERRSRVRERLTYLIFAALVLAIAVATLIGFFDGSYDEVGAVWSAAAFPLGYVFKTYFEEAR